MGEEELLRAASRDLIFAGDVITIIAHHTLDGLKVLATKKAKGKPKDQVELHRSTESSKSKNLIASPAARVKGIYRRLPNSHCKGISRIRKRENEIGEICKGKMDPDGAGESERNQFHRGLPWRCADSMEFLGKWSTRVSVSRST